jgi:hypothetical protein
MPEETDEDRVQSPAGSGLLTLSPQPPTVRVGETVDIATIQEQTRSYIAKLLVLLLAAVTLALIGLTAWHKLSIEDAKDLAGAVLSPLIAVTGTALGFYFGGHVGHGGSK